jgi:hypothetical protein
LQAGVGFSREDDAPANGRCGVARIGRFDLRTRRGAVVAAGFIEAPRGEKIVDLKVECCTLKEEQRSYNKNNQNHHQGGAVTCLPEFAIGRSPPA